MCMRNYNDYPPSQLAEVSEYDNVLIPINETDYIEFTFRWVADIYNDSRGNEKLWNLEFTNIEGYRYTDKDGFQKIGTEELTESDLDGYKEFIKFKVELERRLNHD